MTHPQDLDRRFLLGGLTGAAGIAALAHLAKGGPINPPAGAIAATAKPLAEIEPRIAINSTNTPGDGTTLYKITAPGSYYLIGNINGVSGKSGILIAASNVTVDLGGFSVIGAAGSLNGITAASGLTDIVIHGGNVSGWTNAGIDISNTSRAIFERVVAYGNGNGALRGGSSSVIRNCIAPGNSGPGIVAGANSLVESCAVSDSFQPGISVGANSVVRACTSRSCGSTGFVLGTGGLITDSAAYENDAGGIVVGNGSTVRGCILVSNNTSGISAGARCLISDNYCFGNLNGPGVSITGTSCQVEGNTCHGNGTGLSITAGGSVVIRNTCSGNITNNWSIAGNNHIGPIVNITSAAAAAVSGNAGPNTLTTTDPHANFTL